MARDFVAFLFEHACSLTGHGRGCWLLNESPLRRLWWWSLDLPR